MDGEGMWVGWASQDQKCENALQRLLCRSRVSERHNNLLVVEVTGTAWCESGCNNQSMMMRKMMGAAILMQNRPQGQQW